MYGREFLQLVRLYFTLDGERRDVGNNAQANRREQARTEHADVARRAA